jgi:hypothetical protein
MYRTAVALPTPARRLLTLLALVGLAFGFTAVAELAAQRPAHAICVASPLEGSWKNVNPNTRAMTRVDVAFTCNDVVLCDQYGNCTGGGSGHSVKAWGACSPTDCFWGSRTAVSVSDGWLKAVYNFGFKTSTVWLKTYVYYGRTYLRVYVNNDFTAADGRADYVTDEWMLK